VSEESAAAAAERLVIAVLAVEVLDVVGVLVQGGVDPVGDREVGGLEPLRKRTPRGGDEKNRLFSFCFQHSIRVAAGFARSSYEFYRLRFFFHNGVQEKNHFEKPTFSSAGPRGGPQRGRAPQGAAEGQKGPQPTITKGTLR